MKEKGKGRKMKEKKTKRKILLRRSTLFLSGDRKDIYYSWLCVCVELPKGSGKSCF